MSNLDAQVIALTVVLVVVCVAAVVLRVLFSDRDDDPTIPARVTPAGWYDDIDATIARLDPRPSLRVVRETK